MDENQQTRLLAQAERTLGQRSVDEAVRHVRAIIGPTEIPAGEDDAQRALDKMRAGELPTSTELAALQLVIRLLRPALLSRAGELDPLPDYNRHDPGFEQAWENFRTAIRPLIYSIGRIDRKSDGEPFGTAFLVAPDLVMTNHHVLTELSFGTDALDSGQAVVRFGKEYEGVQRGEAEVLGVAAVHEENDIALLRVEEQQQAPPLTLATEGVELGDFVVAVGYPFKDSERNPLFMDAIYQRIYGVKRAAPGEVVGFKPRRVFHDCSTLGGNSGSPLLSIDRAEVVGLHRTGLFRFRNEAVDGDSVAEFLSGHLDRAG